MAELVAPGLKLPEVGKPPETLGQDRTNVAWKKAYTVLFPGVEAVTAKGQPQIAQRLADGQKAAAAIAQAGKAEAKYEPSTGKYLTPDAADPTNLIEADLADSLPDIIAGLEEVVALNQDIIIPATADKPQQTITNQQAKDALKALTLYVRVEVINSADDKPYQATYDQYCQAIEKKAMELNSLTADQWNALTPAERETHIYNTRKTVGGKYSLEFEKPPLPDVKAETEKPVSIEQQAEETRGMYRTAVHTLEALLEQSGTKIFKRDKKGNITGIDAKELAKLNPNDRIARLAIYVADYFEAQKAHAAHPEALSGGQHNLATLMYLELQQVDSKLKDPRFEQRAGQLQAELTENWLKPAEVDIADIPTAVRMMLISLKVGAINRTNPDQVEGLLNRLTENDRERRVIIKLQGTAERALPKLFGLDVNALTDEKFTEIYANRATVAIEAAAIERREPGFSQAKRKAYQEALKHHLSTKDLDEYLKKHGLPSGLKGLGLGLLIFAPAIQGLLSIGVETERPQG